MQKSAEKGDSLMADHAGQPSALWWRGLRPSASVLAAISASVQPELKTPGSICSWPECKPQTGVARSHHIIKSPEPRARKPTVNRALR
jgi:hypothetical protein